MDGSDILAQAGEIDTGTLELLVPAFAQVRQERDCLYLHCREDSPKRLILGLAGGSALALRAEGIDRIKLYGSRWALGVDLPLGEAAVAAAAIAEKLAAHGALQSSSFKLLLRQACLSLLCEGESVPEQAPTALAILAILRGTAGVEYLQNLVVKGRQRRQKRAAWTFEVDLLALGIEEPLPKEPEPSSADGNDTVEAFQELVAAEDALPEPPRPWWQRLAVLTATPSPPQPVALAIALVSASTLVVVGDRAFQPALTTESAPAPLVVENRPPRQNFNNATLNEKLDLVDWHRQKYRRPPDVMILGSSRALRGVDPTILEETLAAQGYPGLSILNMGINGATARVMRLQILDILSRQQRPRMIIVADGLRAFNNNREDRTYREIASSPGYQLLAAQTPKPAAPPSAHQETALGQRVVQRLLPGLRHRDQGREGLLLGYSWLTQALSDREETLQANFPELKVEMDAKGFLAIEETFEPAAYFATRRIASGEFDSDYRNFNGTGEQMAAFYELAQFCQQQGILLVVVNLPLHESYLDDTRRRYEAFFNGRMQKLAARLGFVYLNLSERWRQNSELFSDPSHLNYRGARVVSRYLGSSKAIPWQRLR